MVPVELIANREALEERFGRWPSFHDAEVLAVRLDNDVKHGRSVRVELDVHIFETTPDVGQDGYFIARLHSLVTLRFDGATDVDLEGFGSQNVLFDLGLESLPDGSADGARLAVDLPSSVGLTGGLRCTSAAVVSVAPWEP